MSKKSKVRQFTCKCNQELNDKGFWALKKIEVLEVDPVLKELKAAREAFENLAPLKAAIHTKTGNEIVIEALTRLDEFIKEVEG